MPLKTSTILFQQFITDNGLRFDYKFFDWKDNPELKAKKTIKLKRLLKGYYKGFAFKGEDFSDNGEVYALKGVNFNSDYTIDFQNIQFLTNDFFDDPKYQNFKVEKNDIVISLVGSIGKISIVDDSYDMLLNQNNIALKINHEQYNIRIFTYIIDGILKGIVKKLYSSAGYAFLRIEDLFALDFPLIPLATQNEIVAQIKPIEDRIASLRNSIIPAQEIINRVFAREFGFDEHLHHEFGKGMTASTQQADDKTMRVFSIPSHELARSSIVRNSTRFHNPPTKKLMDLMDIIDTLYVYDVLAEDIHRGASPKYDPDGTIPVVKTGHLKNGYIEISTDEFVHEDFYKSSIRSQVRQGDILIASTGKGSLGKIDLLEDEQDLVADGHISIVRLDESKYNKQLFVYFFRSILGYFQIERDFTGATNQIELYSDEISQFKIPNISLTEQARIVDEITAELKAQTTITDAIAHERAKIDKIIEQAIV